MAALTGDAGLATSRDDDATGQIAELYLLQAAFHRAKSHQDIDLMVSLWARDCTFEVGGTTFTGRDAVRTFFLGSGSWLHQRQRDRGPDGRDRRPGGGHLGHPRRHRQALLTWRRATEINQGRPLR